MSSSRPPSDHSTLTLGPDHRLNAEAVEHAGLHAATRFQFSPQAAARMKDAHKALQKLHAAGEAIYGLTTGFGPFVKFAAGDHATQGANLIAHLGAGFGPYAEPSVVRAAMLLRAQSVAQGHSGIHPAAADAFLTLLQTGIIPAVPEIGSLGASGDLIPLAHVVRVLTGEGEVLHEGRTAPAAASLKEHGVAAVSLTPRDALALVNGTSLMTAYLAIAVSRAARLLSTAETLIGWLYRTLGCRAQALDPRLHQLRGHAGQAATAAAILQEANRFGPWENPERPLQEIYSIRCAPQILGACRDQLDYARTLVERETNGVNDNPVVVPGDAPAVLHGGNFQGQQIAFAADALNAALTQTAVLVERQIAAVLDPATNGNAPLLLAWEPGSTSGFAGAQLTATALVAELRLHCQACATTSIPSNGNNQDVVSMGTLAARTAYEQTQRLAPVLAVLSLSLSQLVFLKSEGKGMPSTKGDAPPPHTPPFQGLRQDRPLLYDIRNLADQLLRPV